MSIEKIEAAIFSIKSDLFEIKNEQAELYEKFGKFFFDGLPVPVKNSEKYQELLQKFRTTAQYESTCEFEAYALVVRFDSNKDMQSTALAKSFKDLDQNTESQVTLLNALLKN
ncbi:hypothetical protein BpHYR1_046806 [Brachionus plicatilis]|uniref:Uncharacterized protein n=1 Tax=Brachionus plicatilis TaxID=10195 RepID=A0A3M7PN15_BRAPC|nr:hypothetical protein BpHYR1_046806 [Brachionus plicatilis]